MGEDKAPVRRSLFTEPLAGKMVLEVGCGEGNTTRNLAHVLAQYPQTRLIATDISDRFFAQLGRQLAQLPVNLEFRRTSASELLGIADHSIDYVVCYYTLCAINADAGQALLALYRFLQVLKPHGVLFVEEEFPVDQAASARQDVWAQKWRILKAATTLAGGFPYTEFDPRVLARMMEFVGFRQVHWSAHSDVLEGPAALDFFQQRLERLLPSLANGPLQYGFRDMASAVLDAAEQAGGMEVPYYRLSAQKP